MRIATFLSLAMVLLTSVSAEAAGCLGCLDQGFGTGGLVAVGFDYGQSDRDAANASVRIPGVGTVFVVGQVEVAGTGDSDFGIVALRDDGTLEPSFGGDGKVTVAMDFVPLGQDVARDVAWLPWSSGLEWRLVVVGEIERANAGDSDFGVALLRPDGSLEGSASGGRVAVSFDVGDDETDLAFAVAVDPSDRIVVAGPVDSGPGDTDWGFARLGPDLALDPTFGVGGKVVIDVSDLSVVRDIVVQPDGKILAVGTRDFGEHRILVIRLNTDGSLDTTFGLLGFVSVSVNVGGDDGFGVALWQDGRIAVIGETVGGLAIFGVLLSDGTVDAQAMILPSDGCDALRGRAVAIDPVGRMVLGFEADCGGDKDFMVKTVDFTGTGDPTFSASYDFNLGGVSDDRLTSLLLQPDGKVVAAGRVQGPNGDLDFGVLRVWTDIVFADGFESGSASEWTP